MRSNNEKVKAGSVLRINTITLQQIKRYGRTEDGVGLAKK